MYAVIRSYEGGGSSALIDLIEQRRDEVEGLLRGVTGFVGYTVIRTEKGGTTITVCDDKVGTDESAQVARDWVVEHAAAMGVPPPKVTEGDVPLHVAP